MSATAQTLTRVSRTARPHADLLIVPGIASRPVIDRIRALGLRRTIACVACGFVGGGVAWNWTTLLAAGLHLGWLAPAAGIVAGLWIARMIARVDEDDAAA